MTRYERLKVWLDREWKLSKNCNLYLVHGNLVFVIFKNPHGSGWKLKVNGIFGKFIYLTLKDAKVKAFEVMEHYYKKQNEKLSEVINVSEKTYLKLIGFEILCYISENNIYYIHSESNNIVSSNKTKSIALNPNVEPIEKEEFIKTVQNIQSSDWLVMMYKEGILEDKL